MARAGLATCVGEKALWRKQRKEPRRTHRKRTGTNVALAGEKGLMENGANGHGEWGEVGGKYEGGGIDRGGKSQRRRHRALGKKALPKCRLANP